ncbi:hypothetical protein BRYFOR_07617 [Marvinbryantia formatexigens DSM 14469]|uniref:DUF5026 domain-containing protein n=1 Tax=Marvinbryantia formatexigens DSM 14469 TaxID=478749 RepID=C6LG57_9FIRM|nr:DUF5026 domain-containing protein [Marvinbryantia formatexigens]EET60421.1 hypothetical protein BRYFOR_07617 [Marvinbryantia formatexigens DSM 14469]UWO25239.1 DUF5026 domain-containing protein [Marvinbryantia formatexigens DSM 14469]SDH04815.1 protein of unknown function [Marvinbryantia formatexigens]
MLLVKTEVAGFNLTEIRRGTLICARHRTWTQGQPGIVTEASETLLRVQYLPSIQNVRNHYMIPASEVEAGEWEIRYSSDGLESVLTYTVRDAAGGDENAAG